MDGLICEHEQCTCPVDMAEDYCGDSCKRAAANEDDADPHGRCGCKHTSCMAGA